MVSVSRFRALKGWELRVEYFEILSGGVTHGVFSDFRLRGGLGVVMACLQILGCVRETGVVCGAFSDFGLREA